MNFGVEMRGFHVDFVYSGVEIFGFHQSSSYERPCDSNIKNIGLTIPGNWSLEIWQISPVKSGGFSLKFHL